MSGLLSEDLKFINGLPPVADAFAGATVYSDIIDMGDFSRLAFVQFVGTGATGTSTITVEACDDVSASNVIAIKFHSRSVTVADTEAAVVARAAAGYATVAGSNRIEIVSVREDVVGATGYQFVRVKFAEVVDSPVLGGILAFGVPKVKASSARPTSLI